MKWPFNVYQIRINSKTWNACMRYFIYIHSVVESPLKYFVDMFVQWLIKTDTTVHKSAQCPSCPLYNDLRNFCLMTIEFLQFHAWSTLISSPGSKDLSFLYFESKNYSAQKHFVNHCTKVLKSGGKSSVWPKTYITHQYITNDAHTKTIWTIFFRPELNRIVRDL